MKAPALMATIIGIALWFFAALMSGKREAWDASVYWTFFYPIALIVSASLGYLYPERPWRWVLWLFLGQFLGMCLRNGELGSLFPLGLIMFGVLALPGVLAANFATRFRRRSEG